MEIETQLPWRFVQVSRLISGIHCWHQSLGFVSFGAKQ